MNPIPAPTPAAAGDDVPAGMLELAPDRIVSGPWFRTRGARAAFACELLPAMDAGPYALVAPDVAVQLRLETRDQVPGKPGSPGRPGGRGAPWRRRNSGRWYHQ